MKCAIICLLAICAFETVSAINFQPDVTSLYHIFIQEMEVLQATLSQVCSNTIIAATGHGVKEDDLDTCLGFYHALDTERVQNKCIQCLNKADKFNNIPLARECCSENMAELEDQARAVRVRVKACIGKLIREAKRAAVRVPRRGLNNDRVQL